MAEAKPIEVVDTPPGGALGYIAAPLRPLAVPIASLTPDAANARTHDEKNLAAIAASLSRWGQRLPIVVQREGMIVRAGNGRVMAAKSLGWSHIAAVVVDESSVEATAFAIADNRTAELAGWNDETLAALLQSLPDDMRDVTGFDEGDLKELLDTLTPEVVEDEAPEPLPDPVSRTGDLWELGEHRLLCGDSTRGEDVGVVLAGTVPFIMVTDPPYGVAYDGGASNKEKREKLAGDDNADLYEAAFANSPCAVAYAWFAGSRAGEVYSAAIRHKFKPRAMIVWNKLKPHYGAASADYKQRHEPCLYAVRTPPSRFVGDMSEPTVWDIEQPRVNELHPTQKPVECMARPIRNHGGRGDGVYDPFSGSGTTIIAAEQLGRKCYAIEIEPRYVDVAIRRWQKLTGKHATLNGKTWEDVAAERGVSVGN